jgi:hypothetical protein
VALSLAWRGETFRRIQAPGGAAVETPASDIDSAATTLETLKSRTMLTSPASRARLTRSTDG